MSIRTLAELFQAAAGHQKPACLMHKVDGQYLSISTEELASQVRKLAKSLLDAGIRRGDRVALMAENGPHWPIVDFATLSIGAVLVPIYPTLLPEGAAYVARDSGARILFVQGRERLEGMLAVRAEMPAIEKVVAIGAGAGAADIEGFEAFIALGSDVTREEFDAWCALAQPEDLATLIYTSGTTGEPKGVMLTHDNLVSNILSGCQVLGLKGEYTALSFLPLSHSFERLVDYCYFHVGVTIAYAESVQTVAQNLLEVRPHVFVAVPRVYEKVMARVLDTATAAGGLKAKIFRWALGVGRASLAKRLRFEGAGLRAAIADKLVFSKIRARLGGRFVFAISGGAPLARDTAEFFWGAGLPIYEGYGLTETSPVISVNGRGAVKLGTVGKAILGVQVRIAEDGEILAQGPNVMKGYFGRPADTAEVIDAEGWFHTGDIGHVDDEGFLAITDRKKELIVNAYGKNIAPAPIENALKSSRWIAQAVVIGDTRQFLCALLVPDFESVRPWAAAQGIAGDNAALAAHPKLLELVRADVDAVNAELARYEQVRAWALLPQEFTIESGELTPKLSVKRRVVHKKYAAEIERLYGQVEG